MPSVRDLQKRLYNLRGVGYSIECLVGIATFPRKIRAQNDRFEKLEKVIGLQPNYEPISIAAHLPTILNYITSFAFTSRELQRKNSSLAAQNNDLMAKHNDLLQKHDELRQSIDSVAQLLQGFEKSASKAYDRLDSVISESNVHSGSIRELWRRVEFVRSEMLYELMHRSTVRKTEVAPAQEPRILDQQRFESLSNHLRINIGSGHLPDPSYINVDRRELPGIDVVAEATRMPFLPGSVEELFSSHLIEHFPQEELRRIVLPYWHQLLMPGGIFRAVLPDWGEMIHQFNAGTIPFENLREVTFGAQDYEGDFHYNMFSKTSLGILLAEAGFRNITFPVLGRTSGKCIEMEVRAIK